MRGTLMRGTSVFLLSCSDPERSDYPTFYIESELSKGGGLSSTKTENELFNELTSSFSGEEVDSQSLFAQILSQNNAVDNDISRSDH